jgi:hypothetical protein
MTTDSDTIDQIYKEQMAGSYKKAQLLKTNINFKLSHMYKLRLFK